MAPGITRRSSPGVLCSLTTGRLHLVGEQLDPDAQIAGAEALGADAIGYVGLGGQARQSLEETAIAVDRL